MDRTERTVLGALGGYLLALVVIVGLAFAGAGCSAKQYHFSTLSVVSAHTTAALVQDEADASICGQATAPPAPYCLSLEQRKALAPSLSEAFDLSGKAAAGVKALGPGGTLGAVLLADLKRITALLNSVLDSLPSEAKARIQTLTTGGGK